MAWVKTTTQAIGSPAIAAKYDTNAGTGWAVGIDNGEIVPASQPAGKVFFGFVAGNSTLMVESTFNVNDGAWHFVACSSDGTGQASGLHIYIDGRAATLTTVGNSLSGATTNSAPFTIGNSTDGSSLFEGSIAGVAVYNTALTPRRSSSSEKMPEPPGASCRNLPSAAAGIQRFISPISGPMP